VADKPSEQAVLWIGQWIIYHRSINKVVIRRHVWSTIVTTDKIKGRVHAATALSHDQAFLSFYSLVSL
jgi:hypothetical protein